MILIKILFLTISLSLTTTALANEFNFGVGYIGFDVNHYKGSDQSKKYNLYMPYVYYQSETVTADAGIINTRFIRTKHFSMQLSMGANPSVESDSNIARSGMPELLYNFGIGPMAIIHIINDENFQFQIEHSLRREFETDFSFTKAFGITNTTYLTTKLRGESWSIELALGKMFGDKDFHQYYYGVKDQYEKLGRSSYTASSGFSGDVVVLSTKKQFEDFLTYPFLRYDNLKDSVYKNSPLVKKTEYMMIGVGVFYLIF